MSLNTVYDVTYEYGDKIIRRDHVIASAGDENTIKTVLTNNSRSAPSGSIKILAIRNANVPAGSVLS